MLKNLTLNNFRPIKNLEFDFAPLTIIYGKNGAGKSSLMYAPLLLKNILLNPSQSFQNIFNLPAINLGFFEQVVHQHKKENSIEIKLEISFSKENSATYGISLHPQNSYFEFEKNELKSKVRITFPYQLNLHQTLPFENQNISWNGINANLPQSASESVLEFVKDVNETVNFVRKIDIVPLNRGFFKPLYSQVSVTPNLLSEDEVASSLMMEYGYNQGFLSYFCEKIFNKSLKTFTPLSSTSFYLRTLDKNKGGLETDLIHEGFGLNQVVFMLAKILNSNNKFIFIEEPEIHLHPSAQNKLIDSFIEIVKDGGKQICISTHSEVMVSALLTQVSEGKISPNDVKCYFVENQRETKFSEQKINENGTIEGGLTSFMETELENLKAYFKIK